MVKSTLLIAIAAIALASCGGNYNDCVLNSTASADLTKQACARKYEKNTITKAKGIAYATAFNDAGEYTDVKFDYRNNTDRLVTEIKAYLVINLKSGKSQRYSWSFPVLLEPGESMALTGPLDSLPLVRLGDDTSAPLTVAASKTVPL